MGVNQIRFVGRAIAGKGWRIWDRLQKKWWGNPMTDYPQELLVELNADKRPEELVRLTKPPAGKSTRKRQGDKG